MSGEFYWENVLPFLWIQMTEYVSERKSVWESIGGGKKVVGAVYKKLFHF